MLPADSSPSGLDDCSEIARQVYRRGLVVLVDQSDGRVCGLRRELYQQLIELVGDVHIGNRRRLLQFGEMDAALGELAFAGVVGDASAAGVLDIRVFAVGGVLDIPPLLVGGCYGAST